MTIQLSYKIVKEINENLYSIQPSKIFEKKWSNWLGCKYNLLLTQVHQ